MAGDTVSVAKAYNDIMPRFTQDYTCRYFQRRSRGNIKCSGSPWKDLEGVRLDTPSERGGVTRNWYMRLEID